ncbi:MAG: deoxyribodipyrimidine photo-lyase [Chloroflexota bacterium]
MSVIWWVRRDLRLIDNQALEEAVKMGTKVVPIFIFDPFFLNSAYVGSKRWQFLRLGLQALDRDLRAVGSRLIIRSGRPSIVLKKLVEEVEATAVFAEADYSTYARKRDRQLKADIPLKVVPGLTYHHPNDVLKKDGTPYTVFTPYKKQWLQRPLPRRNQLIPKPAQLPQCPDIPSEPLPEADHLPFFPAGESEAQARLTQFTNSFLTQYGSLRDFPGINGTSKLSPYLRFGMLSARQAIVTAVELRAKVKEETAVQSVQTWLDELVWREFYQTILYHFPHVIKGSFRPVYDKIQWRNDPDEFEAWCQGQTGYPIVDAAMRQLLQTGWMHNRARMIVASFLVKDLLIDWRWGERWFMQQLVDGDPAANNGGWQWAAGTGTDAAPYFRIFNPTSQSQKFDAKGEYIRQFVPELKGYPDKEIHTPWQLPPLLQKQYGASVGTDYPFPIVEHKEARLRTLAAYKAAKEAT